MAGFTSSLLIFVLVQLLGEADDLQSNAFFLWMEHCRPGLCRADVGRWLARGFDPTFTIVPSAARNAVYILRLVAGV